MQGTGETGLTTQIGLGDHKKIIRLPVEFYENKLMQVVKKNNSKNKIIILRKRGIVSVSKKIDYFLSENKPQLSVARQRENLIFLIMLRKNNFNYRFTQKLLCQDSVKLTYSVRAYWASNSPRYSIKLR
ncbi:MAG: hypothetical protein V4471_04245 [Pseudomonadota bacterium]